MPEEASARPNILLVTTDQQRFDTVGPNRPDFLRVPHLDALSRKGVLFRNAYSTTPICVPARCTIMSGQPAWIHGMSGNGPSSQALGDAKTLPGRLGELGYQTMAIGKMHFGPHRARHGFDDCAIADDYFLDLARRGETRHQFLHGVGQNEFYPAVSPVEEPLTYTSWIAERCVEFLHRRRDPERPFFLWCSFGKPHPPFDPPQPYLDMYRGHDLGAPASGDWSTDPARCPHLLRAFHYGQGDIEQLMHLNPQVREAYYALATQVDHNLGRVLGALNEACAGEDTAIVFTSDHGEMLGDHGQYGKGHWLESSAHVPMIAVPPPSWKTPAAGTQRDELVSLEDLLPTFVHLAGGRADDAPGQSLFEIARDRGVARPYLEGMGASKPGQPAPARAITDGRWKYLWFRHGPDELLFDLETDPQETRDLSREPAHRAKRDELHAELARRVHERPGGEELSDGRVLPGTSEYEPLELSRQRATQHLGLHTEYHDADVFH